MTRWIDGFKSGGESESIIEIQFLKCKIILVVSVTGSQDWKSLKGVREGLSLRFTIVPTEVDFNENRAVIYWYAFLAP